MTYKGQAKYLEMHRTNGSGEVQRNEPEVLTCVFGLRAAYNSLAILVGGCGLR